MTPSPPWARSWTPLRTFTIGANRKGGLAAVNQRVYGSRINVHLLKNRWYAGMGFFTWKTAMCRDIRKM